ncbi:glycosyl hydrolase family 28 protein [Bifidobacterium vansinderenii]|uniref:Polygalacturonase n=1 Tax=Bifidobacterium vansinderenii TaxID=1984871 RepID=A0A229VWE5_9BIFI|nr:glycosyl hydrolase family 28 protein [Bifidobacterium vansinderenii]OXM99855.1 polygalacturonase [Bifidobacterium vansinderenii]
MLDACVRDDTLTVYWDKPATATAGQRYDVMLNDTAVATVDRTRCRIDGLAAGRDYRVTVSMVDDGGHDDGVNGESAVGDAADDDAVMIGSRVFHTAERKRMIDVTAEPYQAIGDGTTLNTAAIQRALDDCGPHDAVLIPAGTFLTGALRMHSDSELVVSSGAALQGTADPHDYLPMLPSRFEGTELDCYSSLINIGHLDHTAGPNCRNVTIRGGGTIASGGRALAEAVIERERGRVEAELAATGQSLDDYEKPETIPGRVRPRLINMSNASHVEIADVTLKDGASWNVHMIYSDHIVTHGCTFESHDVWNGDGWDPDSSEDCVIFDCDFDTGDDIIAIKSGKNPEGNVINRPTRRVRIFDCRATRGGHGLAIGSEMSGGVEDVRIWDCDLSGLWYGVEVKTTPKRGGWVRGLHVRDTVMRHVIIRAVPYNDDGVAAGVPPVLEDFRFERVQLLGGVPADADEGAPREAIYIQGLPEPAPPIRGVAFHDVALGVATGVGDAEPGAYDIVANRCEGLEIRDVRCG